MCVCKYSNKKYFQAIALNQINFKLSKMKLLVEAYARPIA